SPIPSPSIDPPPSLPALPLASGVIPRTSESGWGGGRDDEEPDALQTNTLAELYLRQGLVDRAVEVYRSMLGVDPGNVRARRRLGELTEGIGGEMDFAGGRMEESTAVPDPPTQSDMVVPPALALALQPGRLDAAAGPQRRRETINRLEKWLGIIRRPEPGPTGGSVR
ncbi:MAG: tetratricopeptide repeat protein, partial [Acidobacteria bacterium]|nr:tetratricopeptide repeat protein [Acidobacteriota bacterium]